MTLTIEAQNIQARGSVQIFNQVHYHEAPTGTVAGLDEPTDLLPQFEAAKDYLDLNDPKAALAILSRLEKEHQHRFTGYTRFRCLAARGHALRLLGDAEGAARCFLSAKQFRPDSEIATSLEILAHISLRNDARAFDLASEARNLFRESVQIAGLWVQCAPLSKTIDQLELEIPKHLQTDPSVAIGMAIAAGRRGEISKAANYARTAAEKAPDWVEAKRLSATLVIDQHARMVVIKDTSELSAACVALRECIDKVQSLGNADEVARLYLNLAVGHRLLGDSAAADGAVSWAFRLAPGNDDVRFRYAILLLCQGKRDEAIALLDDRIRSQPFAVQLIWGQMKAQRGLPGDQDTALDLLRSQFENLDHEDHELSSSWIDTLAKLYLSRRDFGAALDLLNGQRARTDLTEIRRLVLLANIERTAGNLENARELAKQMSGYLSDAGCDDAEDAAKLLENLDEFELALQAWKIAVEADSALDTLRHVMSLSIQQHDDEYVLRLGQDCRGAGVFDRPLIEMELAVLQKISPTRCEQLLSELLQTLPDGALPRYLRMRRTLLGVTLNREDLIEGDFARYPRLDEIDEYLCHPAVNALSRADPTRAVELAYNLVRRYPDSVNAHWAMISSLMEPGSGKRHPVIPQPTAVDLNSAVRLEDLPANEFHWHVIEDRTDIRPTLNEVANNGAVARALLGKVVGDEVDIVEAFGSKRRARIAEILHKWVFRFRDCIEQFSTRFPEQQFIKKFNVDTKAAPQQAFRELLAFMYEAQAHRTDLLRLYGETPALPIPLLAHGIHKSVILTMAEIAATDGIRLRSTIGPPENPDNGRPPLSSYRELVLETTAVGTMFLLDQSSDFRMCAHMDRWPYHRLISEKSVEELERLLDELSSDNDRIGAESVAGSVVPRVTSAEEMSRWSSHLRPKVQRLILAIRNNCEIISGSTLPDIPVEHRDALADVFGRAGAESLQLAKQRGALLWTDDGVISQIGSREIGCRCTSTQKICREVIFKDNPLGLRQVTLGLLTLKYDATEFSIDDALAAAAQVNWNVSAMPFAAILNCFAEPGIPSQPLLSLAAALLRAVWSNSLLEVHAAPLTQRILDRVGRRHDGRSIALSLFRNADAICGPQIRGPLIIGPHLLAAENMRRVIRNWISFNQSASVIHPDGSQSP